MLKNWSYGFVITLLSFSWAWEVRATTEACNADSAAVLTEVRRLSEGKNYRAAISCLKIAISRNPADRDLIYARIRVQAWRGNHAQARAEFDRVGGSDPESLALDEDLKRLSASVSDRNSSFGPTALGTDRQELNEISIGAAFTWDSFGGSGLQSQLGYARWMGNFKLRTSALRQSAEKFQNRNEFALGVGVGFASESTYSEVFYESAFKLVTLNRAGISLYHEHAITERFFAFANVKKSYYATDSSMNYALGGGWYGTNYYPKLSLYSPLDGSGVGAAVFDCLRLSRIWEFGLRLTAGQIQNAGRGTQDKLTVAIAGGGILANANITSTLRIESVYQQRAANQYRDSLGEVRINWAL